MNHAPSDEAASRFVADRRPQELTVVALEDEEIFCPVCAYNLTGILTGRCPECGALFDRDALIAAQQANEITLIPWDDPEEMPYLKRLRDTLAICLVRPERFAFAFSVQPQTSRVVSFFAIVTGATVVFGWICFALYALLTQEVLGPAPGFMRRVPVDFAEGSLAVALFIVLTLLATTLLTGALLYAACPHYDGKRHFRPWLSIAAYAASHYLLIGAATPLAILVPLILGEFGTAEDLVIAVIIWLGCSVLYVLTLRPVVSCRTAEMESFRFVIGFIGVMHFGTCFLSLGAAAMTAKIVCETLRTL